MKNFIGALLYALFLTVGLSAHAQDLHFSQFFEAPLLRNPSLAGIYSGDIRFQGVYRSQWGSVTVPYQTGSFNLEYKKPIGRGDDFLTTGMQILYDRAGTTNFTTSSLLPALNYHKSLSSEKNSYLSLGFMGGLVQRKIDRTKMTTNNHFDGGGYNPSLGDGETFTNSGYSYLDGSVGMAFNSRLGSNDNDNYFVGLAYHHFNRPKNSFYQNPIVELKPKIVGSAGFKVTIDEASYLTIQADQTVQGSYKETMIGGLYSYKVGDNPEAPLYTLHVGAFMRLKDAVIPMVKIDYHPFSIGFSYDANISPLSVASRSNGGMELSISYVGFFDRDNSTRNAVLCPRF
jgi:type IX secretion system PorP/SprF family membrane protein